MPQRAGDDMARRWRIGLVLLGGFLACPRASVVSAPPPEPTEAPMPRPVSTQSYRKSLEEMTRAKGSVATGQDNGVVLQVQAKSRRLATTNRQVLDFEWTISYEGPRKPLIILAPSLTNFTAGQTYVRFHAFPKGSEVGRSTVVASPNLADKVGVINAIKFGLPREYYLTVRKKQQATGRETVPLNDLKQHYLKKYSTEFSATTAPDFYAELVHEPWDRGRVHDLDAWTGELRVVLRVHPTPTMW